LAAASFDNNTSLSDHEEEEEEPNYTTSDDNENAPSISSDLPENMALPLMGGVRSFEDAHQYGFTADFSPPSSPIACNEEDESRGQLMMTEYTHIEPDTLLEGEDEEEDPDETNADEIRTEEEVEGQAGFLLLPPPLDDADISPNSNSNEADEASGTRRRNSDEGSLHDSMEILEDVSTADHFDLEHEEQQQHHESAGMQVANELVATALGNDEELDLEEHELQQQFLLLPPPGRRISASLHSPSRDISESSGRYVVKEGSEELMF
jgi:hypothetical protein